MKKEKLTLRQKKIIEIIADKKNNSPITIADISERIKVSTRTILREMPYVERWINNHNFKFIKKPGVGLKIDEDDKNKQLLMELLEAADIKKEFSKSERLKIILSELIKNNEPLKLYYFMSLLNVSEGTLSTDLYDLQDYLKNFNMEIKRKQGVGIYLEGDIEKLSRKLLGSAGENIYIPNK